MSVTELDVKSIPEDVLDELVNKQEAYILKMHYLYDISYKDIAELCKLSISRIYQIKDRAFRKLLHPSRAKILQQYWKGTNDE